MVLWGTLELQIQDAIKPDPELYAFLPLGQRSSSPLRQPASGMAEPLYNPLKARGASRQTWPYCQQGTLYPPTLRSSGRQPQEARFPPLTSDR
jgi:hypothetical protein